MKRGWTLVALLIGGTIAMTPTPMDARSGVSNGGTPASQTPAPAKAEGGADAIRPFAAWEQPELLVADPRAAFKSLR